MLIFYPNLFFINQLLLLFIDQNLFTFFLIHISLLLILQLTPILVITSIWFFTPFTIIWLPFIAFLFLVQLLHQIFITPIDLIQNSLFMSYYFFSQPYLSMSQLVHLHERKPMNYLSLAYPCPSMESNDTSIYPW